MAPKIKGISFQQNNGFDITYDNQLLLEKVGRIIMTYKGERVNNPEFGSLLETWLFEKGDVLPQHVESSLIRDIEFYEPLVRVLRASVTYTKEEAKIYIMLQRRDTLETLTFNEYISL